VRVSCKTLAAVTSDCGKPFTLTSAALLRERLDAYLSKDAVDDILTLTDAGEIVHRLISDSDARALGFLPLLQ
jgi:hypothetical protein